jgi:D-alanyl-D-alanine carboxypeptidase
MRGWFRGFSVLGVALAVISCGGSDGGTSADGIGPDVASDVPVDVADTLDVAAEGSDDASAPPPEIDPAVAAALQGILDEHVVFSAEPGITLAVYSAEGAYWEGAAGVRQIQNADPMTAETGFRVGSNTKPFMATLVMGLVEEGVLSLDDPLSKYVPGYDAWKDIPLRYLVGMQSGIADYLTVPALMLDLVKHPGEPVTPDEILGYVADKPLLYVPGEGANYSNSNYMLLGLVLEQVTGKTPDVLLAERITGPLGLAHTVLDLTGEVRPDVAHGYMDLNLVGMIFGVPAAVIAFIPQESIVEGTVIDSSYLFHPSMTWTAGALISDAHDMATFMRALLTGKILKPETIEQMEQTKVLPILGDPVPYGLGLQVRSTDYGDAYGHGGLNFGYQAGTYRLPEHGVTFSHMHNYLPEQSDLFQNAMLGVLVDGNTTLPAACTPPDALFADVPADTLLVRFKGPMNAEGATPKPTPGIGNMKLTKADGTTAPLYGLGAKATLKVQGGATRLELESLAPGTSTSGEVVMADVNFDAAWLDGLAGEGDATTDAATKSAVFATMATLDLVDGTTTPLKMCFTAVRDFSRPASVHLCDADTFTPDAGETLRAFATVPITTSAAVVAGTLSALGLPACYCFDDAGSATACQ